MHSRIVDDHVSENGDRGVVVEAAVGYDDAEERWMQALDVLAEYGRREDAEDR